MDDVNDDDEAIPASKRRARSISASESASTTTTQAMAVTGKRLHPGVNQKAVKVDKTPVLHARSPPSDDIFGNERASAEEHGRQANDDELSDDEPGDDEEHGEVLTKKQPQYYHDAILESVGWAQKGSMNSLRDFPFARSHRITDLPVYHLVDKYIERNRHLTKSKSQARKLGFRDFDFHHTNLATIIDFEQPKWWDFNFSYYERSPQEVTQQVWQGRVKQREAFALTSLPHQRIFQVLEANKISNGTACVVLGFETVPQLCTFFDTVGASFFGGLGQLNRYNHWLCPTGTDRFQTIVDRLLNASSPIATGKHAAAARILSAISEEEATPYDPEADTIIPPYIVRRGELESGLDADEICMVDMPLTLLCGVLRFVRWAPASILETSPRFDLPPGNPADELRFGLTDDLWHQGLTAWNFYSERRRGRKALDTAGKPSAKEAPSGLPIITARDRGRMLEANKSDFMRKNAPAFNSLAYSGHFRFAEPIGDVQASAGGSAIAILNRRLKNRIAFLTHLGRLHTSGWSGTNSRKVAPENLLPLRPLLDKGSLRKIIDAVARDFAPCQHSGVDDASLDSMSNVLDGEQTAEFVEQQQAVAKRMADVRQVGGIMDPEHAQSLSKSIISHALEIQTRVSRYPPADGNFASAVEAFQIEVDDWTTFDPKTDLTIPQIAGAQPGMAFLPHQIYDAWTMRKAEGSPTGGMLLANEVGTGKTAIQGLVVLQGYMSARSSGVAGPFGPTLVLCPALIALQTFREYRKFFGEMLHTRLFYGTAATAPGDTWRAKHAIYQKEFEEIMRACARDPDNPENARYVIITSYQTAICHWTETTVRLLYEGGEREADAHEARSGSSYDGKKGSGRDDNNISVEFASSRAGFDASKSETSSYSADEAGDEELDPLENGSSDIEDLFSADLSSDDVIERLISAHRSRLQRLKDAQMATNGVTIASYVHMALRMVSFDPTQAIFERVIVDECQAFRNPTSANARLLALIPKRHLHMLSATPSMNSIRDLSGLFYQFGLSTQLPFSIDSPADEDSGLYNNPPALDPLDFNLPESEQYWDQSYSVKDRARIRQWCIQTGHPLWALHPQYTRLLSDQANYRSDWVFDKLYRMMCSRRSAKTPLVLPDGRKCFPCDGVPLMRVYTIEVAHSGKGAENLAGYVDRLETNLSRTTGDEPTDHLDISPLLYGEDRGAECSLDTSIRCILKLVSTDMLFARMLVSKDAISESDPDALQSRLAKSMHLRTAKGTQAAYREYPKSVAVNVNPAHGVEHTDHIIDADPDGGLSYMFSAAYSKDKLHPYSDRYSMVRWAQVESPVINKILDMALRWKNQGHRFLLFCANEFSQQHVIAILEMAGFKTTTIRSRCSHAEQEASIEYFNDLQSDCDCFVANSDISYSGTNLHLACSYGIVFQWPNNIPSLLQLMGRLQRKGQTHEVTWYIIRNNGSYYDSEELALVRKFANQLRLESVMPKGVKHPELQKLLACELLKNLIAQPFNRFPWMTFEPGLTADFNQKRYRDMGSLCTAISRIIWEMDESDRRDPETLQLLGNTIDELIESWADEPFDFSTLTWNKLKQKVMELETQRTGKARGKRGRSSGTSAARKSGKLPRLRH